MREQINENREAVEIDLQKLMLAYLRKWWLIALGVILAAGISLYVTAFHITPMYRASVTIYVNNSRADQTVEYISSSNLSTAQRLVSTYVNIIESDSVLQKVVDENNLDCTPAYIRSIMSAAQKDETEIFTVSITHPNPQEAADIANAIALVAPGEITDIVEGSSTKIIDYAKVPTGRYSPSFQKNTMIGGVLGGILAMAYITLRHLMDVRIKTSEDLEQIFDIPVLGQIPAFNAVDTKKKSGYGYEGSSLSMSDTKQGGVN